MNIYERLIVAVTIIIIVVVIVLSPTVYNVVTINTLAQHNYNSTGFAKELNK